MELNTNKNSFLETVLGKASRHENCQPPGTGSRLTETLGVTSTLKIVKWEQETHWKTRRSGFWKHKLRFLLFNSSWKNCRVFLVSVGGRSPCLCESWTYTSFGQLCYGCLSWGEAFNWYIVFENGPLLNCHCLQNRNGLCVSFPEICLFWVATILKKLKSVCGAPRQHILKPRGIHSFIFS